MGFRLYHIHQVQDCAQRSLSGCKEQLCLFLTRYVIIVIIRNIAAEH